MTDTEGDARPSRLRFIVKELVILAIGVVVLFIALAVIVSLSGVTMCCQ